MKCINSIFILLNFFVIFSFGLALPLINEVSNINSTVIRPRAVTHRLGPRDILCEPWTWPQGKCHVFTLSYQEDGSNFIVDFDARCTPISIAKNIKFNPAVAIIDVGKGAVRGGTFAWVTFDGWNIGPRVGYKLNGQDNWYGRDHPETIHCERGNNDDTGLYCITKFPC